MKRIAIFGKVLNNSNCTYMQQIIDLLEYKGCQLKFYKPFLKDLSQQEINIPESSLTFNSYSDIVGCTDFLFSIGGDGTLLDTATLVRDSGIPILGINLGRLGFLSSIPKEMIEEAINNLFSGNYTLHAHSLLNLETPDNIFGDVNFALNELSIHRHDPFTMLTISVDVNGKHLTSYWADGLLIATPTGSTAYSLSCGGPILTPDSKNFVITPIAPHNLTIRPIVIPDDSEIVVHVGGRQNEFLVAMDSRSVMVREKTFLTIRKERFFVNLIRMPNMDFFTTLREKLHWGFDKRN